MTVCSHLSGIHLPGIMCENCKPASGGGQLPFSYPQYYPPQRACQHCYCQQERVEMKLHDKCCMCGNRKLSKFR
jgi:hypothetical protein